MSDPIQYAASDHFAYPDEADGRAEQEIPDHLKQHIAELENEREKYRTLFSQANEAIFLVELEDDGRGQGRLFAEVNDTACAWLGYSPQELSRLAPYEIVAHEDRPLLSAYRKTLVDKQWLTVEMGLLTNSGRVIPVELSARIFRMGEKLMGLYIARDSSRTIAFRNALAEAAERWRSMTESSPDHILVIGEDGIIEFCNHDLFGYPVESIVGMMFLDHIPVAYRAFAEDCLKKLFQEGKSQFHEVEFAQSPERNSIFFVHINPVSLAGRIKSASVRLVDVTERKTVERVLMENEARYRNFMEGFIGIAYEKDPALGRPVFFSGAVAAITGYTEEDFLSGRINWDNMVHPLDRASRDDDISSAGVMEYRIINRDGKTVYVKESIKRLPGSGFSGMTSGVIYDVTGQKLREEIIARRDRDLETSNRSLTEMNTTLGILLKKRETDRAEMEQNVTENLGRVLMPLLVKLKSSGLNAAQVSYLDAIETGFAEVVSGFGRTLSSHRFRLTPTEVQVAALVKEGQSTKDIAKMLNMSKSTVDTHRNNIRKKLEIKKQGVNLRAYLATLS